MSNIETVQEIYAAIGRGDIPAVLEVLADSVEWEYGVNSTDVPWLQPGCGRAYVAELFAKLALLLEIHQLQRTAFLESGNIVVVLFDLEMTVKATGRKIVEEDEVNIWHFNSEGRVSRFRHRSDTHQHMLANGAEVARVAAG